jgi:hypothetical protein
VKEKRIDLAVLIIAVVVIAAAAGIGGYYLGSRGRGVGVGGGWWNKDWEYRRQVTVNNSGSLLQNYQISMNVNYTGPMQMDFSDLRFVDGSTQLSYWIENYDYGKSATVWVKIPSVPANGKKTIWMYYGNPVASSESNGRATFILFDDFNSGDYADYGDVTAGSAVVEERDGYLFLSDSGPRTQAAWVRAKVTFSPPVVITCRTMRSSYYDENDPFTQIAWRWDGVFAVEFPANCLEHFIEGSFELWGVNSENRTILSTVTGAPPLNTWFIEKIIDDGYHVTTYCNDVLKNETTTTFSKGNYFGLGCRKSNSQAVYYDWVQVRSYANPEPSASVGSEEKL